MRVEGARLVDKVCVITGAASATGSAVAERLTREGAIVIGADKRAHSVGVQSLQVDLTDEVQVRNLYERVKAAFGQIDVIYNNAGLNDPDDHSALDMPIEVWERVLAANLTTTFLSCKHCIPHLLANDPPSGSVINAASFLAVLGAATAQMAYSAAKAGVVQLSRDLGVHLARSGVRVNALVLGPVETPQLRELFTRIGPEEAARRFALMPMGRFGTLAELAGTVAYLASEDAGFVTAPRSRSTAESAPHTPCPSDACE